MHIRAPSPTSRSSVRVKPISARHRLDLATVVGIVGAFTLIIVAVVLGGTPTAFIDLPAICIVIGGTFGVVTACFSAGDVWAAIKAMRTTVMHRGRNPSEVAVLLLQLSQIARSKGILALQDYTKTQTGDGLLRQGLSMVVDGSNGDEVERIMTQEVQAAALRDSRSVGVVRKAAEISPAMGLIGTLVGLVQMLGNLEDPTTIGPSMAVALLTTFYGAILANMVFTPLASKLERNSAEDMIVNHLYVLASASIGRQENPRRLEMLLNTVLPPAHRVDHFG